MTVDWDTHTLQGTCTIQNKYSKCTKYWVLRDQQNHVVTLHGLCHFRLNGVGGLAYLFNMYRVFFFRRRKH